MGAPPVNLFYHELAVSGVLALKRPALKPPTLQPPLLQAACECDVYRGDCIHHKYNLARSL